MLKDHLTDSSQIPVREWVALDAEHRQAIETRLEHNAAGTEPAPNPALVDELATEMTQTPHAFARRDLVPAVAHLPLPQWQRFRGWQAGIRRNDPATEDELYAIKRGLQVATKMLPAAAPDDIATSCRAELVEEIGTWCRINGKSPNDADIVGMLRRVAPGFHAQHTPERDDNPSSQDAPGFLFINGDSNRFLGLWPRLQPPHAAFLARRLGFEKVQKHPIDAKGEAVYRNPQTGEYIKRVTDPRTPGVWEKFDKDGKRLGIYDYSLRMPFRDPPPIVPFVPSPPAVPQLPVLPPRPALGPSIVPARGLPPAGILPPVPIPGALRVGPASRPSEAAKGGMSLYERSGAEWRWYPGDRRHHPHWDYNSQDSKLTVAQLSTRRDDGSHETKMKVTDHAERAHSGSRLHSGLQVGRYPLVHRRRAISSTIGRAS